MVDGYYTERGRSALENRLKSIYAIYEEVPEEQYPVTLPMLGFPKLELLTREQCLGHINELQQILMVMVTKDGRR